MSSLFFLSFLFPGLYICPEKGECSVVATFTILRIKSVGQALYVLRLCRKCTLWKFIKDVELFLDSIVLDQCATYERIFARNIKRWIYLFIFHSICSVIMIVVACVSPRFQITWILEVTTRPLTPSPEVFAVKFFADSLYFAAWFFPVALSSALMQSLSYAFGEFYRHLCTQRENGNSLSVKTSVKEVRQKFLTLTNLCNQLDDMLNGILMVSYLCDIVLACLTLWVGTYTMKEAWLRVMFTGSLFLPLSIMFILSKHASQLYDKVKFYVIF